MNTKPTMSLSTIEEAVEEAGARESKYDALSTGSAVAETVWAVLMVACVLFLLWSMLGHGPTYGPSETGENHSGASASRPNHYRAGHHGLAGRRGSLLRGATEPAVNLDRCHAASTGSTVANGCVARTSSRRDPASRQAPKSSWGGF
jgi:hypothetical protein